VLSEVIRSNIRAGSLIIGDQFASYGSVCQNHTLGNNEYLKDINYRHQWVNHKKDFKDPTTGLHIKAMRGMNKQLVPAYLDECLWFFSTGTITDQ
ncbi:TPA: hypothetical protein N0F65_000987, partial [Lagenidium giganteum]